MNTTKMKAIVCTEYGAPEVLQLQEISKPSPKENEVLIKVKAASVTAADTMMRKGDPVIGRLFLGLRRPKYPVTGTGFSGVIEAVGASVKLFRVGEKVFGESIFGSGTNAEYLCLPEDGVVARIPEGMTFEATCSVCDGPLTSINFLKDLANIKAGQKVLIIGASGSVGSAGIQLAKYFGAHVTGVCSSKNVSLVKSLGADEVIDYIHADFTTNGKRYDIIYDTVGKSSFSVAKNSLTEKGAYLSPVLDMGLLFQVIKTAMFGDKKAKFAATGARAIPELRGLLNELVEIINDGKLKMIIDRRYPLKQVAAAHRYVDTGRKKGNLAIIVS